jgi:hypothetical protein
MDARLLAWILGLFLLAAAALAPTVRADAPECRVSGWVVESASDHLVIESQNERMRFTLPKRKKEKEPRAQIGERVTVIYASPLKPGAVATEVIGGEAEEPGVAPSPVLDDRAFYPA